MASTVPCERTRATVAGLRDATCVTTGGRLRQRDAAWRWSGSPHAAHLRGPRSLPQSRDTQIRAAAQGSTWWLKAGVGERTAQSRAHMWRQVKQTAFLPTAARMCPRLRRHCRPAAEGPKPTRQTLVILSLALARTCRWRRDACASGWQNRRGRTESPNTIQSTTGSSQGTMRGGGSAAAAVSCLLPGVPSRRQGNVHTAVAADNVPAKGVDLVHAHNELWPWGGVDARSRRQSVLGAAGPPALAAPRRTYSQKGLCFSR